MQPNFTLKHLWGSSWKFIMCAFLLSLSFQGIKAQNVEKISKATQVNSKINTVELSKKAVVNSSVSNDKVVANKLQGSKKKSLQLNTKLSVENAKKSVTTEALKEKLEKVKAIEQSQSKEAILAKDECVKPRTSGN